MVLEELSVLQSGGFKNRDTFAQGPFRIYCVNQLRTNSQIARCMCHFFLHYRSSPFKVILTV